MRCRALGRLASRFRRGDCPLILGFLIMSNLIDKRVTGQYHTTCFWKRPVSISPLVSHRFCWQSDGWGQQGGPISSRSAVSRMRTSVSFEAAWRDLNRRSAVLWLLFFGCIPGMLLLVDPLSELFFRDGPFLVLVFALAWMPAIAWAGSRMASFVCPRCTRAFFEDRYFFWPLKRGCALCHLAKCAKDISPAAIRAKGVSAEFT